MNNNRTTLGLVGAAIVTILMGTSVALACGSGTPSLTTTNSGDGNNHWFIGYDTSTGNNYATDVWLYHEKNNSSPNTGNGVASSIWTMTAYEPSWYSLLNATFDQVGLCAQYNTIQSGSGGTQYGYPVFFFAEQDNNGYWQYNATVGSASNYAHELRSGWSYGGPNNTDVLYGNVDGNRLSSYNSSSWNIPNHEQNCMEEISPNSTPGVGFGSQTSPERIYQTTYIDMNNATHSVTSGSSFDDATQECWGNSTGASDFRVYDTRN